MITKEIVFKFNEDFNEYGQGSLEIMVNGESGFSVYDGEPEDNNLGRNFSDCFQIKNLLKIAYEAGKSGLELKFEEVKS